MKTKELQEQANRVAKTTNQNLVSGLFLKSEIDPDLKTIIETWPKLSIELRTVVVKIMESQSLNEHIIKEKVRTRNMFYSLPKEQVNVVHDDDLEKFLDSLGILPKFQAGQLKCKFCKISITFENLHSVFPQSRDIKIVCDNPGCIRELSSLLRGGTINL